MPTSVVGLRTLIRQMWRLSHLSLEGFTSLISGTVEEGNLNFHMRAAAGENAFVKDGTPKPIRIRQQPVAKSKRVGNAICDDDDDDDDECIFTGPNGQYANVVASFSQDDLTRKYMDFDLSASGSIFRRLLQNKDRK